MAFVTARRCKKCGKKRGERHVVTTKPPTPEEQKEWIASGVAEATDGCEVVLGGICCHGHYSWLVTLNKVPLDAQPKREPERIKIPRKKIQDKGDRMKPEKEVKEAVAFGKYRAGSATGNLFVLLSRGKAVSKGEMKKAVGKEADVDARVATLRRNGKQFNSWNVETLEDGRVKMRLLPGWEAKMKKLFGGRNGGRATGASRGSSKKAKKAATAKSSKDGGRRWKQES